MDECFERDSPAFLFPCLNALWSALSLQALHHMSIAREEFVILLGLVLHVSTLFSN